MGIVKRNLYFTVYNFQNKSLLEIGCGEGRGVEELLPHFTQYLGLDKIGEVIQTLQLKYPGVEFKQAVIPPFEGI